MLQSAVPARRVQPWQALNDSLGLYVPGYPVPDDRLAIDLVLDRDAAARKVRALAAQLTQAFGLISSGS